jgi:hypothetical protein
MKITSELYQTIADFSGTSAELQRVYRGTKTNFFKRLQRTIADIYSTDYCKSNYSTVITEDYS